MIITKVTEKFMISSSRIVNITLDSKEDEKHRVYVVRGLKAVLLTYVMMIYEARNSPWLLNSASCVGQL